MPSVFGSFPIEVKQGGPQPSRVQLVFPLLAFVFIIISVAPVSEIKTRCLIPQSCECFSKTPSELLKPQVACGCHSHVAALAGRCSKPCCKNQMSKYYTLVWVNYSNFCLLEAARNSSVVREHPGRWSLGASCVYCLSPGLRVATFC